MEWKREREKEIREFKEEQRKTARICSSCGAEHHCNANICSSCFREKFGIS